MVFKRADRSPPNRHRESSCVTPANRTRTVGRLDRSAELPVAVPRTIAAAAGDRDNDRDASLPLRNPRHPLAAVRRLAGRLSERFGKDALMVGADRAQVRRPARTHRRTPEAASDLRRSPGIGVLRGTPADPDQPQARRGCCEAEGVWLRHQADRAWIEWGLCWPPLTVARPRCQECRTPWPCPEALSAHEHICRCGRHLAVFAPARAREA